MDKIPQELINKLPSRLVAAVVDLLFEQYQCGRKSTGAEIIDGDGVWINKLGKIYELEDIAKLG